MVVGLGGDRDNIQVVLGLDDQAPTGPDCTGCHEGAVLLERELLSRSEEVGDTSKDEAPLFPGQKVSIESTFGNIVVEYRFRLLCKSSGKKSCDAYLHDRSPRSRYG